MSETAPSGAPWRLSPRLEPYRPLIRVPDGFTLEDLLNQVGSFPADSYLARERTKVAHQVSLLTRLFNAGCLVVPAHHRPGYDPGTGFEAQAGPAPAPRPHGNVEPEEGALKTAH